MTIVGFKSANYEIRHL